MAHRMCVDRDYVEWRVQCGPGPQRQVEGEAVAYDQPPVVTMKFYKGPDGPFFAPVSRDTCLRLDKLETAELQELLDGARRWRGGEAEAEG